MAEGKWIGGLTAATSVTEAARRTLRARLEVVDHFLGLALREPAKDLEYVHQLRVGTRRARAALDIFALCLPAKVSKRARRLLRRLRRAAGTARDWDVFSIALTQRQRRAKQRSPGTDFLLGYAAGRRAVAQIDLEEASGDISAGFDRFLDETVAAVDEPRGAASPRTLLDLARPLLYDLVCELDQAAMRDLNDYHHLHQVRIIGKRLRYAMEVFVSCFPPVFRDTLYPAVEDMQEILGRANDSQVAAQHLTAIRDRVRASWPADWKRFRPEIESLLRSHQRRLPRERRQFLAWLKDLGEIGWPKFFSSSRQASPGV